MVRLRTDRWYSADGQRRVRKQVAIQSSGHRRLLSLCFLLALVLVLMQKAADPGNVSQAFRALGVPLGDEEAAAELPANRPPDTLPRNGLDYPHSRVEDSDGQDGNATDPANTTMIGREAGIWQAACNDLIPRLLEDATENQLSQLAFRWLAVVPPRTVGRLAMESPKPDLQSLLPLESQSLYKLRQLQQRLLGNREDNSSPQFDQSQSESSEWLALLARFEEEWLGMWGLLKSTESVDLDSGTTREISDELSQALTAFVDGKLFAGLQDGSPWRRSEMLAFNRLLARATQLANQPPATSTLPLLSTLQLESEHATYRGKVIRYRGSLRRADYIERSLKGQAGDEVGDKTGGFDGSYWVFWARGEDQATQPVAIYATQGVAGDMAAQVDGQHYPEVEVTGLVAKRLAYASKSGVQVAPTLFASEMRMRVADHGNSPPMPKAHLGREMLVAFGLGLVLAVIVLFPLVLRWRSSRVGLASSRSLSGQASKGTSKLNRMILWAACLGCGPYLVNHPTWAQESNELAVELPWESQQDTGEQVRQLLQARFRDAIGESDMTGIQQYLDGAATPFPNALLKLVHTLKQIGWRVGDTSSPAIPQESNADAAWSLELNGAGLRFEPMTQAGIVTRAASAALTTEQELWFQKSDADQVFQLQLMPTEQLASFEDNQNTLPVLCVRCPSQWLSGPPLRQPAVIQGFALRSVATKQIVCLFAQAPQWRLDGAASLATSAQPGWSPDVPRQALILGRAGFDLTNLDLVASRNQQPLRSDEAEAMFSMLRIVGTPNSASRALAELESKLGPVEAMADPPRAFGRPIDWNVRLVSGTLVPIPSTAHQAELGSDHYIQLDGFVDIGDQRVRYQVGDEEIVFDREFPITIVTRNESSFVPKARLEQGELSWTIGKFARLRGCFYRLWSFDSELMQQQAEKARQAAPLVIAHELTPSVPPVVPSRTGEIGWFGYALCVATLCILAGILHQAFRRDHRRIHSRMR